MANFVHLAYVDTITKIRRSGIKPKQIQSSKNPIGVFCTPVITDYYASHQWARELKRFKNKKM